MANDAKSILIESPTFKSCYSVSVTIDPYREDRAMAVGNGSGIK